MSDSGEEDEEVLFGLRRQSAKKQASAALELSRLDILEHGQSNAPIAKRGVIFFSSLPTDMRPTEIRNIFSQFGEIFRQKFVPKQTGAEQQTTSYIAGQAITLKKRSGGKISSSGSSKHSQGVQFSHGWLEFLNEKQARQAAASMHGTTVAVKHRRRCSGEVWACKFLPDFQWGDLSTEVEGRRRQTQQAMFDARQKERKAMEAFRAACQDSKRKRHSKSFVVVDKDQPPTHRNLFQQSDRTDSAPQRETNSKKKKYIIASKQPQDTSSSSAAASKVKSKRSDVGGAKKKKKSKIV